MYSRLPRFSSKHTRPGSRFHQAFVITYGRSGSTLLGGILNSIDGWMIRGENNNFIPALFESYRRIEIAVSEKSGDGARSPTSPWWGLNEINLNKLVHSLRKAVDEVLLGDTSRIPRVYGFKEIRYPWISKQGELHELLNFLIKMYPRCVLIFNYRNLDDVMKSKWWAEGDLNHRLAHRQILENFEKDAHEYARSNPGHCFEINYENILGPGPAVRALFDFLGESYDENKLQKVLNTRHSY